MKRRQAKHGKPSNSDTFCSFLMFSCCLAATCFVFNVRVEVVCLLKLYIYIYYVLLMYVKRYIIFCMDRYIYNSFVLKITMLDIYIYICI